jgi:predicted phosphodiesterase
MRAAAAGNYEVCHAALDKIEHLRPLKPYELAFRGTVYLMSGDVDRAEAVYREVASSTSASEHANDKYANLYTRARLASVHGTRQEVLALEAEARSLSCDAIVRGWLPLD